MMNGSIHHDKANVASRHAARAFFDALHRHQRTEQDRLLSAWHLPPQLDRAVRRLLLDARRDTTELLARVTPRSNHFPAGVLIDDQYRIEAPIGEGGTSMVYRAIDRYSGRPVAIKLLSGRRGDRTLNRRLRREVSLVSRLDHPNILGFYRHGLWRDTPFLVMKLVSGGSLRQRIDPRKPWTADQTLRIGIPIARALAYSHARGIVHCDIKPENILLTPTKASLDPLVADFGIGHLAGRSQKQRMEDLAFSPSYASPEQVAGTKTDARSDVYSLGITLLECLLGTAPPSELKLDITAFERWAASCLSSRKGASDRWLTGILLRSCHPLRARRPARAAALAEELADGPTTS